MEDLQALLSEGKVDAFNSARSRDRIDLFAADLSEAKLPGVDFSSANLEKADLTDADLTDAVLARATFNGADITNTQLNSAMGIKSRWREAWVEDSDFSEGDFTGADFTEAEFSGTSFKAAVLSSARFVRCSLTGCDLSDADLTEARLTEGKFGGCDLSRAIMREARIKETVLDKATLVEADMTRVRAGGASFRGADLSGAVLVGADLSGADLTDAIVTGANFTRADLTGATLDGVAMDEAVFTEAALDGDLAALGLGKHPAPKALLIEDPTVATADGVAAVLWDNAEADATTVPRLTVGKLGRKTLKTVALPAPTDLIVARALTIHQGNAVALLLVERPGGTVAMVSTVGTDGKTVSTWHHRMPYTPAARPVLRSEGDTLLLYGISREGPGLQVHAVTAEELAVLHASALRNVRGFVSDHHPIVLNKGGVLFQVGRRGAGEPVSGANGFPGRSCAAAPLGEGLALAWLPSGSRGLQISSVAPGETAETHLLLKKEAIGAVDLAKSGDQAYAVFTRELEDGSNTVSAWAVSVPDGTPFPVASGPEYDVSEVRALPHADSALVACTLLDGSLEIFELKNNKAKSRWKVA